MTLAVSGTDLAESLRYIDASWAGFNPLLGGIALLAERLLCLGSLVVVFLGACLLFFSWDRGFWIKINMFENNELGWLDGFLYRINCYIFQRVGRFRFDFQLSTYHILDKLIVKK